MFPKNYHIFHFSLVWKRERELKSKFQTVKRYEDNVEDLLTSFSNPTQYQENDLEDLFEKTIKENKTSKNRRKLIYSCITFNQLHLKIFKTFRIFIKSFCKKFLETGGFDVEENHENVYQKLCEKSFTTIRFFVRKTRVICLLS